MWYRVLTMGFLLGVTGWATAKPPSLPQATEDDCRTGEEPAPGIVIQPFSPTGGAYRLVPECECGEESESAEACESVIWIDAVTPVYLDLLRLWWEGIQQAVRAERSQTSGASITPATWSAPRNAARRGVRCGTITCSPPNRGVCSYSFTLPDGSVRKGMLNVPVHGGKPSAQSAVIKSSVQSAQPGQVRQIQFIIQQPPAKNGAGSMIKTSKIVPANVTKNVSCCGCGKDCKCGKDGKNCCACCTCGKDAANSAAKKNSKKNGNGCCPANPSADCCDGDDECCEECCCCDKDSSDSVGCGCNAQNCRCVNTCNCNTKNRSKKSCPFARIFQSCPLFRHCAIKVVVRFDCVRGLVGTVEISNNPNVPCCCTGGCCCPLGCFCPMGYRGPVGCCPPAGQIGVCAALGDCLRVLGKMGTACNSSAGCGAMGIPPLAMPQGCFWPVQANHAPVAAPFRQPSDLTLGPWAPLHVPCLPMVPTVVPLGVIAGLVGTPPCPPMPWSMPSMIVGQDGAMCCPPYPPVARAGYGITVPSCPPACASQPLVEVCPRVDVPRVRACPPTAEEIAQEVVERLTKLDRAARLFKKAERLRQSGKLEEARRCYEQVACICPESPCAQRAHHRMKEVTAQLNQGQCGATEESEPEDDSNDEVSILLERCRRALLAGKVAEARTLARKALAIDPDRVAANALVYKTHLLLQVEQEASKAKSDKAKADKKGGSRTNGGQPISSAVRPAVIFLRPDNPSGREIVILQVEVADERELQLVDGAASGESACSDACPGSTCPGGGEEVSEPTNEPSCEEVCGARCVEPNQCAACRAHDAEMSAFARKVLEAVRNVLCTCTDVDIRPGAMRFQCEITIGGDSVTFFAGSFEDGWRTRIGKDLRSMQREHNQQVQDWIESTNEGRRVD